MYFNFLLFAVVLISCTIHDTFSPQYYPHLPPSIFTFILALFIFVSSGPGCVPEDEAYIPTYLEAFPPLPEKGAPGEKAGEPVSAWGSRIRPIKASVITQVSYHTLKHKKSHC